MSDRVCLVGPAYPYRGGISHHTSLLAQEFAKDHDVRVITFKRMYPSFLFPGKTQYDESENRVGVDSQRLIDSMNPLSFWQTARAIRAFDPALVIFQWWHPFFAFLAWTIVFLLKRWTQARIVFVCHNVLPHESSPLDRVLIRLAFRQVSNFMVHSQEDRRNLMKLNPAAVIAVHPLPLFDAFGHGRYTRESARAALGVDGRVLLFFGLIRAYKGLGLLLEAFALCAAELDATLLIVGEFYEDPGPYAKQIESLGVWDRIRIVDEYVANEEVEKYFAACDLLVLPYLSATQSAIVQVAYSYDKPVVVTAVGGLPDVVDDGETGFVVPPRDPQALAGAIRRFFAEDRAGEMSRNIASAKERFSWSRCKSLIVGLGRD